MGHLYPSVLYPPIYKNLQRIKLHHVNTSFLLEEIYPTRETRIWLNDNFVSLV